MGPREALPSRASSSSASSSSPSQRRRRSATTRLRAQLGGSIHALHDGSDETVAGQLERVIVGAGAVEQVDDTRSVTAVYGRPQGSALLLAVHLALHIVARCRARAVARPRGARTQVELAHNLLGDRFLEASCCLSGKATSHFL